MPKKNPATNNLVVVSDIHAGCRMGLCPPEGVDLDDGGHYDPSPLQRKLWAHWADFWTRWVPEATHGEPFAVAINGDALDGVHHGSTTQVSQNLEDQAAIALAILAPVVELCGGRFYMLRGTEAHVGQSGVNEERIAKTLRAIPNASGQRSRYELWFRVGDCLTHLAHHIGTTSSSAHEASAINAELTAAYVEAARWGEDPPDVVIRSHRHRYAEVRFGTARGFGISAVTPGWQGKTPFSYRIAGGRQSPPQFGGLLVRQGDRRWYVEPQVWTPTRETPAQ